MDISLLKGSLPDNPMVTSLLSEHDQLSDRIGQQEDVLHRAAKGGLEALQSDPLIKEHPVWAGIRGFTSGKGALGGILEQDQYKVANNQKQHALVQAYTQMIQEADMKRRDKIDGWLMDSVKGAGNQPFAWTYLKNDQGDIVAANKKDPRLSFPISASDMPEILKMLPGQMELLKDRIDLTQPNPATGRPYTDSDLNDAAFASAAQIVNQAKKGNSGVGSPNPQAQPNPKAQPLLGTPISGVPPEMMNTPSGQPTPQEEEILPQLKALIEQRNELPPASPERAQLNEQISQLKKGMGDVAWGGIFKDPTKTPRSSGIPMAPQLTVKAQEEEGKLYGQQLKESTERIGTYHKTKSDIDKMMHLVNRGVFSGAWSDSQKLVGQALSILDPGGALAKTASNTEDYFQSVVKHARAGLKDFGGSDSNTDVLLNIQAASGGDTTQLGKIKIIAALTADLEIQRMMDEERKSWYEQHSGNMRGFNPTREYPRLTVAVIPTGDSHPNGIPKVRMEKITFEQYKDRVSQKYAGQKNRPSESQIIGWWKDFAANAGDIR
jgi:hypothetical protein